MKEKYNIEQPHLKENPYSVPEGYFSTFQSNISEITSQKGSKSGAWSVIKPQLALVSVFAFVFLMGYAAINIFSPDVVVTGSDKFAANTALMEEHQLDASFIDFFDSEADSLTQKQEIDPAEIIEYLNNDAGIVYLASLD